MMNNTKKPLRYSEGFKLYLRMETKQKQIGHGPKIDQHAKSPDDVEPVEHVEPTVVLTPDVMSFGVLGYMATQGIDKLKGTLGWEKYKRGIPDACAESFMDPESSPRVRMKFLELLARYLNVTMVEAIERLLIFIITIKTKSDNVDKYGAAESKPVMINLSGLNTSKTKKNICDAGFWNKVFEVLVSRDDICRGQKINVTFKNSNVFQFPPDTMMRFTNVLGVCDIGMDFSGNKHMINLDGVVELTSLTSLNLTKIQLASMTLFFTKIKNLTALTNLILDRKIPLRKRMIENISQLRSLEHFSCYVQLFVDVDNMDEQQFFEHISTLQSLQSLELELFYGNLSATNGAGLAYLQRLPLLTSLSIDECYGMADIGIINICELQNLERLGLIGLKKDISSDALRRIGNLKKLKYLDLSGSGCVNCENLNYIIPNLQVSHLILPICHNISSSIMWDFISLGTNIETLEHLDLRKCECLTTYSLRELQRLRNLKSLSLTISISPPNQDQGDLILNIIGSISTLNYLNLEILFFKDDKNTLHHCCTDDGLRQLLNLSELQHLEIDILRNSRGVFSKDLKMMIEHKRTSWLYGIGERMQSLKTLKIKSPAFALDSADIMNIGRLESIKSLDIFCKEDVEIEKFMRFVNTQLLEHLILIGPLITLNDFAKYHTYFQSLLVLYVYNSADKPRDYTSEHSVREFLRENLPFIDIW